MITDIILDELSNEELILLAKNGNNNAYEYFFEKNVRFSHFIAKQYNNINFIPYDDKVQACNFGLLKAYNTFDSNKGNKFTTYAAYIMHNEIKMELRRNRKHEKNISMNYSINTDREGNQLFLEDILEMPEDVAIEDKISYYEAINKCLELSKERDKNIFIKYHIEELSQKEIADMFGIQQSYVSRVLIAMKKKINQLLEFGEIRHKINIGSIKNDTPQRATINKPRLHYVFVNYPNLSPKHVAKILMISLDSVYTHKGYFRKGKYKNIPLDDSIKPYIEKYLKSI